ncbi:chemotaxis protein CheX [Ethanoligenens harbinense]|uniref:chemotaxis protein CheX n=1 Tax=Ethanoligenens harbinense TaxID=253239 RepID=UPI000EA2F586|nr:chemotaxis protein CheX [Ethanoligenens harbinense]AYF41792.1 hypothetical protein CN246_09225 [Ethanoligenens harbinense]
MDTKFAAIFIDAWNTVLESFSTKHIMSANVEPPKENLNSRDIYVLMGIVGDIDGQVFMSMDAETGKILASEMLGGMEVTDVDELVVSAVGEMCNMVMGNACSSISLQNTTVDITPPTVIAGEEIPPLRIQPSYNISLVLEDMEAIDFNVAVKTA